MNAREFRLKVVPQSEFFRAVLGRQPNNQNVYLIIGKEYSFSPVKTTFLMPPLSNYDFYLFPTNLTPSVLCNCWP